jgi:preprotein translocase subunit SecE
MNIKKFLVDTIAEYKKIEWPSNREIIILSLVVVVISSAISFYLGLFDVAFIFLLNKLGI